MVKPYINRRLVLISSSLVALIAFTLTIVPAINRSDTKRARQYELEAVPVGVARAKEECQKEGLGKAICDSITGDATTTECGGRVCWIVHANAKDVYAYSAGVIVQEKDKRLQAIDFIRDRITP